MSADTALNNKLHKHDKRFIRRITTAIILALGAIFASELVGFMIQVSQIEREGKTSTVVSASANQRMLSQRLALLSLALVNVQSESTREKTKKAFQTEIAEMENTHQRLIAGDPLKGIPVEKSADIKNLFFEEPVLLDQKVRDFIAYAKTIINSEDKDLKPENLALHALTEMSTDLSHHFETLTAQYRKEGIEGMLGLKQLAIKLLMAQLCLVLAGGLFIFYPLIRRLKSEFNKRTLAQAELIDQNKELEHFAAIVAHDLKAPLNNIGGFSQYLRTRFAKENDSELNSILELMISGVSRMSEMIDELLNYARLTRKDRNLEQVSLTETIKKVLLDFDQKIIEDKAQVLLETLPTINCDRIQIEHLFMNLISNALKYRHPDRIPRIRIQEITENKETDMVKIAVEDNGRGFPVGSEEWMFEPFRRLNPKEAVEGSGFGLSLCRKIAVLIRLVKCIGRCWHLRQ